MRLSHHLPALLLVAAGLSPTSAADLTKIDRTLKDEPKYTTATPKYCLLVFGQEARTRVWLVHDCDIMHVLDSPDGKSPKKWRQAKRSYSTFLLGDIWEDGGKVRHKNLRYSANSRFVRLMVQINGKMHLAGRDWRGRLEFATKAKEAPIVHFDGPRTLDLYFDQQPLISDQHEDLSVVVGTPGVGAGTFALFYTDSYPKNAWPTAVIEFPAKEGGKPIVLKVRLAEE
jgi:hypothetical protein